MRKNAYIFFISFIIIIAFLQSCMHDDLLRDFDKLHYNKKTEGVFIINEGNFTYGNSSLSYYNIKDDEVINNIFYKTNALPLGDVATSMQVQDSLAYIVINNSGKIYVFNINNFKYVGKITSFTSPRYIHFVNDEKAYVTDLYAKKITIFNPKTFKITGSINVNNNETEFYQHSTEKMVQLGNFVYINCWSFDNKILVINTENDIVTDSITVAKQPNSLVIDKNNMLWVLSDGGFEGSSYGQEKPAITKINTESLQIEKTFVFNDVNASPTKLCINGSKDTLYYIYNDFGGENVQNKGVFKMSIYSDKLSTEAIIPQNDKLFYGLGINPSNSNIYVSDAIDYVQNGKVYIYSSQGKKVNTLNVGIIPNSFYFK